MRDDFHVRHSQRVPADLRASSLHQRLAGVGELTDLTASNPTCCGIDYPEDDLARALAVATTSLYRPDPRGLRAARASIAEKAAPGGLAVEPSRILLTASTSEAYSQLLTLFCDPGDIVAAPAPSYPLIDVLADLAGVRVERYRLEYDGRWRLDKQSLGRALEGGARLVVAVSPNNPTGSVVAAQDAAALRSLCSAYGVPLISDEVFATYPFGSEPLPTLGCDSEAPLTFVLDGLSKRAGLPGIKVGWVVAFGRGADDALERLAWIADAHLSVSVPAQRALADLLRLGQEVHRQIHARVRCNRATLARSLAVVAAVELLEADGGWTSVLRLPRIMSDDDWVITVASHARALVHPGYFYDLAVDSHLVVGLLTEPETFAAAIERLAAVVGERV